MWSRRVEVRPGKHLGWWVEGRWSNGRLFMLTWWPAERLARMVAALVGPRRAGGEARTARPGS